ncbi:MAG TPA: cyclic nucleotide-binding domain-containing protein [Pirellulales bacterium]|nr:cyclic nucleotide-binding domain-containing protein [Pirellulales bacterium]
MTTETVALDLFKQIPIFRGLSPDECGRLADVVSLHEYNPGEIVIKQGEESQRLWVLLEGKCEVFHHMDGEAADPKTSGDRPKGVKPGEPIVLATLEPYSNFGEMSFFHPAPHSASVRAKTAVKLLAIERAKYDRLCERESSAACKLAMNTVASLADRLRRMDEWVDELVSRGQANQRVPEWNRLRATLFDGWKL